MSEVTTHSPEEAITGRFGKPFHKSVPMSEVLWAADDSNTPERCHIVENDDGVQLQADGSG